MLIFIGCHVCRPTNEFYGKQVKHYMIVITVFIIEPRHEISNNVVCATSEGSDQPEHMRSLIRAFASPLNILLVLGY